MTDFVSIPYGHRGGNSCRLAPPKDNCPPVYRPRNPRASSLYQLFDSHYETVKAVWEERFERQYGFWRGHWDSAVAAYLDCGLFELGFRSRQVPELQIRVPRRVLLQVSGTLSILWREASRDFCRATPTQDSRRCASRSMGVYAMDTVMMMRFEQEFELPTRPRSEARNQFIRDNLAELRQRFRVVSHFPGPPKNYRRRSRI